jgi:ParB family chromosome partitioning protein
MNKDNKKKLGKGLSAIISTHSMPVNPLEKHIVDDSARIIDLSLDKITANPEQPRTRFNDVTLRGLAESIESVGLIEPIIVRKTDKGYLVVAGERRLRAVKLLKHSTIKAIVIEADEEKNYTMALIENIQRENLNPIEEAKAYKTLIEKFNLKQADVAKLVGKERATITNSLRLLNLSDDIQSDISDGLISLSHAKVLLSAPEEKHKELHRLILQEDLSVRALESILKGESQIQTNSKESASGKTISKKDKDAHIKKVEEELRRVLGTKIEIKHSGNKGKIEISYYSLDDFERIVDMFVEK